MKYVYSVTLLLVLVVGVLSATVNAASPPVCSYKNSEGETIFLTYLPLLKKGEDYVDFGKDGKCMRRAICTDTFRTELEECSKYPITCANKKGFTGVFPACCIKC